MIVRSLYLSSFLLFRYTPKPSSISSLKNPLLATKKYTTISVTKTLSKKALRKNLPEYILQQKLNTCSKNNDLNEALTLYEQALATKTVLSLNHYNVLLYLCSSDQNSCDKGFEIFKQMGIDKISPNEATFTSLARLAYLKQDPEMAFDLVKKMKKYDIPPKLRSYGPALFGFCEQKNVEKAFLVDSDMIESGVLAEEAEISALLKVSSESKKSERVYEMLHRLRSRIRQVKEETARILESWFCSEEAGKIGNKEWNVENVRKGVLEGGGGWHGKGWLGNGKWKVITTNIDGNGVCLECNEKLVCIDIDPKETESFGVSLTNLASEREVKADFLHFRYHMPWLVGKGYRYIKTYCEGIVNNFDVILGLKLRIPFELTAFLARVAYRMDAPLEWLTHEWLQKHGPFDAVIDGANVGLLSGHNFSFSHLNSVIKKMQQLSPSKRLPLVVLHRSRVTGGPAQNPRNKKLLESWKKAGALYATPAGSNDDWYWLFAAVSCNCLLVTNDEMRDHLFQLLGTNFFPRWKEKHQVRLMVNDKSGPTLHMPPPYSIVIQESEQGSWHIPTVVGDDLETPRQWVCATRSSRGVQ